MAEGAGAMRRHRVDGDEQLGSGGDGREFVEWRLVFGRVDDIWICAGQFSAGEAALQVDPVDGDEIDHEPRSETTTR
jgi:hypothetical protein